MEKLITAPDRMSSREVAELTGKQHAHVMRDIRTMCIALAESKCGFVCESASYTSANGQQYEMYNMDKETTICLLTGYDAGARMKVIQRWQALEGGVVALTPAEQLLAQAQQMVAQERRVAAVEREQQAQQQQVRHIELQIAEIEAKQTTIDTAHYTISGYASLQKRKVPLSIANGYGRRAANLSKEQGYAVGSVPDAKYGSIGSYHIDILKQVFAVPLTAVVRTLPVR